MVVKAVVTYKYCVLGGITAQIEVFSLKELTVCAYVLLHTYNILYFSTTTHFKYKLSQVHCTSHKTEF